MGPKARGNAIECVRVRVREAKCGRTLGVECE